MVRPARLELATFWFVADLTCCDCEVAITPYDFGTCRETGYHDAGERYQCLESGARAMPMNSLCRTYPLQFTIHRYFLAISAGALNSSPVSLLMVT